MNIAYVGTYSRNHSKGIYHLAMENGLPCIIGYTIAQSPSYLALTDTALYAVRESQGIGGVCSYRIQGDGSLTPTGTVFSGENVPCHVCADGQLLYAAHYGAGTVGVYPLDAHQALAAPGQILPHSGASVDPRQQSPHAHQCVITPDGAFLAVCDLGTDDVVFYPRGDRGLCIPGEKVHMPPGTGPRHAVFGKNGLWYVVGELSCEVLVYQGYGHHAKLLAHQSTLRSQDPESYCSALRLSPDGSLLLVTVRGADTLVLFPVDEAGRLCEPSHTPTQGHWPRDAEFTPDGRFVLCANERGHTLTSFAVEGTRLDYRASLPLPAPSCICFVKGD